MTSILRLSIVILTLTTAPFALKAEGNLQKDIKYLKTRVELVNFEALCRAANDLSQSYPDQYDLESDLAQIN